MLYKQEFTHVLISPVEYATDGDVRKADVIVVPAPTNAQRAILAKLEQEQAKAIMTAALKFSDRATGDKAPTEKKDEVSNTDAEQHIIMLAGNGFDLDVGYENIKALFVSKNSAKMDGKENMTSSLFEDLSMPDVRILLGKYLLNFLNFSQPQ